ncbi:MAG: hypothetical protein QW084_05640, partial [Candidatus Hadarchaeales archaeon]
ELTFYPRALALYGRKAPGLPPPFSWPPLLLLLLAGSLMAVGAAGYFVYLWRFRPILPKVPLASLVRPKVKLPEKVVPAVPLRKLEPARPAFEELPKAEPLTVKPVRPSPIPAPEEALQSLLRAGRAPPGAPPPAEVLARLARVAKPVEPHVRPEELAAKMKARPLPERREGTETARAPEARETLEKLKKLMGRKDEGSE